MRKLVIAQDVATDERPIRIPVACLDDWPEQVDAGIKNKYRWENLGDVKTPVGGCQDHVARLAQGDFELTMDNRWRMQKPSSSVDISAPAVIFASYP